MGVPPGLGAPLTFGPDKLVSYELGFKSTVFDRRMTFDLAAFYIDWSQIQLTVSAGGFGFLGNGGKAKSKGSGSRVAIRARARPAAVGQRQLDRSETRR